MKIKYLIVVVLLVLVTVGCKNNDKVDEQQNNQTNNQSNNIAYESKQWKEKTFFSSVAAPSVDVDRLREDYNKNGKQNYAVIINNFSYEDFYKYIMKLESDGFHYEYVNESVPKDVSSLADQTETSWSGSKDSIYIIATWRSNKNQYYNGYNLHLLFYNYDYTKVILD